MNDGEWRRGLRWRRGKKESGRWEGERERQRKEKRESQKIEAKVSDVFLIC